MFKRTSILTLALAVTTPTLALDSAPFTDQQTAAAQAEGEVEKPGTGAWVNYDFVPGDRVLFTEDFEDDTVGDFPRRLTFVAGNWDVVEWQGMNLLRHTGPRRSAVRIELPEELPERFTIEIEAFFPDPVHRMLVSTEENPRSQRGNAVQIYPQGTGLKGGPDSDVESLEPVRDSLEQGLTPIRVMVDGQYAKVYVNETRVANVPNAQIARSNFIVLYNTFTASQEDPMYINSIRVAAGGRDLYDTLEAEGRVATQGIYFGTDSDVIRPESTPTLTEIGDMLTEHADLRLSIEGHTDSDGDEAYNQELSERRAAAVKAYLVETFGVDAGRLDTVGRGESNPVAGNDTPEGKQQNRRVELVRQGG